LIKYYPEWGRAYASHWDATQFYVGVCDNKNMLGMVCMVFGFAGVWRVFHAWAGRRHERLKNVFVHGAVLAMAVWLLVISDSKTSLACFVLTSGLIAAHTFFKIGRRRAVVHTLVLAEILVCFSVLFLGIGSSALSSLGRNSTLTGRTDIWQVLLTVPINPIVGTGFESFWLGKRMQYLWSFPIVNGLNEAHNGYFETYLNLGWIGIVLLAVLFWSAYRNTLRLLDSDPEAGRLRLGYIVITVIYNFTEAGIRTSDLVWIAFVLAAIALPQRLPSRRRMTQLSPAESSRAAVEQFA
jgi:O-antigen ligase